MYCTVYTVYYKWDTLLHFLTELVPNFIEFLKTLYLGTGL
jgi:hypothetical protein